MSDNDNVRAPDLEILTPVRVWFSIGEGRTVDIPETAHVVQEISAILDLFNVTVYVEVIDGKTGSVHHPRL